MRFCFLFYFIFYRYQVIDFAGGSLLRIEPVRRKPDLSEIECRAENGAGDPVYAQATLTVYDGKNAFFLTNFLFRHVLVLKLKYKTT